MPELINRVARLEDRANLNDLVARYFLAVDGDDVSGLNDIFTHDATFSVSGALCGADRDQVIAFLVEQRGNMGLTLHTPNYGLFTLTGLDSAEGLVGAHLELVLGGVSYFGAVRYQDSYRRVNHEWRIAKRDMRTIHVAPWAEVAEAFASPHPVRWPGVAPAPSDFPRKA